MLVVLSSLSRTVGNHKIMSAFSLKNSLKIYNYQDNRLNTFNGIKALCMLWVIFGHTYSFSLNAGVTNFITLQYQTNGWLFLFIQAGYFAVDVFFYIGGFLMAYAVLK